jgi:hypothetical protein
MADVTTNAGVLAAKYRQRAAAVPGAMRRGVRRWLLEVEAGAVRRTTGSGAAGDYPVPIRTGALRRYHGVRQLGDAAGLVFNRAAHAHAIHSTGFRAYGNPHAPFHQPRPFLADAAREVDGLAILRHELRGVMRA